MHIGIGYRTIHFESDQRSHRILAIRIGQFVQPYYSKGNVELTIFGQNLLVIDEQNVTRNWSSRGSGSWSRRWRQRHIYSDEAVPVQAHLGAEAFHCICPAYPQVAIFRGNVYIEADQCSYRVSAVRIGQSIEPDYPQRNIKLRILGQDLASIDEQDLPGLVSGCRGRHCSGCWKRGWDKGESRSSCQCGGCR